MIVIIGASFLIIFALAVLAVGVGLKYYEAQRARKVSGMLDTVSGTASATGQTKLLVNNPTQQKFQLDDLVAHVPGLSGLQQKIQQAGLDWTVAQLLVRMAVLALLGALAGTKLRVLIYPALSSTALAIIFGSLPYVYVVRKRSTRLSEFEAQFPEALDFLARAMRAGHAFTTSLEMLSVESAEPLGPEFRRVFNEQNLGSPVDVVLRSLAVRVPLLDVRFFVSAVLLQRETGGNLSEILTNLAYVIRERFRLRGQVKAASAHGRITAMVLTILPVALTLGLLLIAPGYLQSLAQDDDGKILILFAIAGQLLGYYIMRRICNIKV